MLRNRTIQYNATIIEALKKMDVLDKKLLVVLKKNKFYGLLSAGDIQRAIIKNKRLEIPVLEVLRKNIRIATPDNSLEDIKQMMFEFRMELCPVVNTLQEITEVYFWEDVFQDKEPQPRSHFNVPVVIMAGGFGTRLKPLTNVLPKPLIPIGKKTMLEEIFDRFSFHGCNQFFVSVNYKAELIEYYIKNQKLPFDINYFKEDKPMGTAGSMSLLKGKINETFFVTNCDILVEQDYSEILAYHKTNKNEITIVAALKSFHIPYGTIETGDNGKLLLLTEKPDVTFKINSGMYILESHLINEIPNDQFFHVTDLIEKVKGRSGNVGVFPISEKSWKDVGSWNEISQYYKNE